jgi:hypothetical protein
VFILGLAAWAMWAGVDPGTAQAFSPPEHGDGSAPEEGGTHVPLVEGDHEAQAGEAAAHTATDAHGQAGPVFVTPPHLPTEVEVGVYLIGLVEISPPNESFPTFKAEVFMDLEWHDPRLAFDQAEVGNEREVFLEHEAELELERIWWPDVEFENEQGERHTESRELVIHHDGKVEYAERFQAVFHVDMHLERFPFDHQNLTVHIESFSWDDRYVVFKTLDEKTGFNEDFHTLEWQLHDVHTEVHAKKEVRSPETFSEYVYSINVDRDPGFYIWKIAIPLLLIVLFNWATFWMPGEPATSRMERSVIALLTVVAFHQVVAGNLPRIGYLTFLDGMVYVAFITVGGTMLTTVWCQRQEFLGRPERVAKLDFIARIVFPAWLVAALTVLWFVYHG